MAQLACVLVLASRCVVSFGLQGKNPISAGLVLASWFFVRASSMQKGVVVLVLPSRARTVHRCIRSTSAAHLVGLPRGGHLSIM